MTIIYPPSRSQKAVGLRLRVEDITCALPVNRNQNAAVHEQVAEPANQLAPNPKKGVLFDDNELFSPSLISSTHCFIIC